MNQDFFDLFHEDGYEGEDEEVYLEDTELNAMYEGDPERFKKRLIMAQKNPIFETDHERMRFIVRQSKLRDGIYDSIKMVACKGREGGSVCETIRMMRDLGVELKDDSYLVLGYFESTEVFVDPIAFLKAFPELDQFISRLLEMPWFRYTESVERYALGKEKWRQDYFETAVVFLVENQSHHWCHSPEFVFDFMCLEPTLGNLVLMANSCNLTDFGSRLLTFINSPLNISEIPVASKHLVMDLKRRIDAILTETIDRDSWGFPEFPCDVNHSMHPESDTVMVFNGLLKEDPRSALRLVIKALLIFLLRMKTTTKINFGFFDFSRFFPRGVVDHSEISQWHLIYLCETGKLGKNWDKIRDIRTFAGCVGRCGWIDQTMVKRLMAAFDMGVFSRGYINRSICTYLCVLVAEGFFRVLDDSDFVHYHEGYEAARRTIRFFKVTKTLPNELLCMITRYAFVRLNPQDEMTFRNVFDLMRGYMTNLAGWASSGLIDVD